MKLLRFLILIVLAPFLYALAYEAYLFLVSNVRAYLVTGFTAGFAAYLLLYVPLLRDLVVFIEHFEHELAHAIVAFVSLSTIRRLIVNPIPEPDEEGSKVTVSHLNCLGYLAPYYLPVFVLPLLVIKPLVIPQFRGAMNVLIGVATGFHYARLFREFRWSQTDIRETGLIVSLCLTAVLNVMFLVIILCAVLDRYSSMLDYFENSLVRTPKFYVDAWRWLTAMLSETSS